MTYEQGIRIASRTFAAYLLFWVISDATLIPRQVLDIVHEVKGPIVDRSVFSAFKASFYLRVYILYLFENILRMALWLMAAGWFYRCTPRIQRFFTAQEAPDESSRAGGPP